jgi:hypothetical protein
MPHPGHGQETESHEVHEGQQELLEESLRLLVRKPAKESGFANSRCTCHALESVRSETHVCVHEDQQAVSSVLCQLETGMLLAAPSFWKGRRGDQSETRVATAQFEDDSGCVILGGVVHDDHFEFHSSVQENGLHSCADRSGLIPRGDEN